ncbi:MAG: TolC family protein [Planctomycetes bacterium]|nr:TolC family protein [Planctomycetota bacterium]
MRYLMWVSVIVLLTLCQAGLLASAFATASADKDEPKTGKRLSLEECLQIAAQNNRQALIMDEAANQADAKLAEAQSRLYPSINGNLTYRRVDEVTSFEPVPGMGKVTIGSLDNYAAEVSVKESLYMGGRIRSGIRSAQLGKLTQSTQKEDLMRNLNFLVKKSYYDVLLNDETANVNLKTEEVVKAHLDDVTKQNREGLASNYDVLRAQVQLSNVRTLRIQNQSTLQKSKLALVSILGLPLEESDNLFLTDKLIYKEILPNASDIEGAAFANRPDLRSAQVRIDLQKEMVKMAKAENLPTASLSWSYGEEKPSRKVFGGVEWGNYWNLVAVVAIPVFEGGRVRAKVRQENSALQQAEMSLNDLREKIRLELTHALLGLRDAFALINSQKDSVKQAEEGLRLVEIGYKNGVNTQLEVMDAQMALDTASKNYIQAIYMYNIARANLEAVIGK